MVARSLKQGSNSAFTSEHLLGLCVNVFVQKQQKQDRQENRPAPDQQQGEGRPALLRQTPCSSVRAQGALSPVRSCRLPLASSVLGRLPRASAKCTPCCSPST